MSKSFLSNAIQFEIAYIIGADAVYKSRTYQLLRTLSVDYR